MQTCAFSPSPARNTPKPALLRSGWWIAILNPPGGSALLFCRHAPERGFNSCSQGLYKSLACDNRTPPDRHTPAALVRTGKSQHVPEGEPLASTTKLKWQGALFPRCTRRTCYVGEQARPPSAPQSTVDGVRKSHRLLSTCTKLLRALGGSHLREPLSTVKNPSWPVALLD